MPTASLILAMPWGCCRGSFSTPWKAHPASASLPLLAGRWNKGRSVRQIPRHTQTHTLLIPFVCPSPCSHSPRSPPHSRPPRCLIPGWLMALQVPAGMDALALGFSSRNPLKRSCCCCFASPSPPSPAAGKQKKKNPKNGGKRGGKSRIAHPPPQRGLRLLGAGQRGGPALCERGERAEMGREVLAGLEKRPCIPPPAKSFPFSVAAFLRGSMESSLRWEGAATASPAPAGLGSGAPGTGKGCPSHPECPAAGSSRPTSISEEHEPKILQSLGIFH